MPGPAADTEPPVQILLVDDQPANLLALEAVLDGPGQGLVRAGSGEQALRLLAADDFAVVLLDVNMPGLDGFAAAKLIRSQERSRHTPIIFLTGYDSDAFPVVEAYKLGAVDYLVKPLVPEILRAKVAVFVELARQARQLRAQAEELHRAAQERFARFMRHLPGLAWIKDARGRYVYVNEAAERAFGRPRAELHGRSDHDLFPPATADHFRENDRRALAEGAVQAVETLEQPDGVAHHSLVSKFTIPGPAGEPALVGGMAIDITDRLRAEEALREAGRRKDEFLAMLGHELRNPLAPIRSAVAALRQAGGGPLVEQARDVIDRQAALLARLVDDLLDVSRLSHGKITLHRCPVELAEVVAGAVETCRPLLEARGHALTLDLPPAPVWLSADPARLTQVVVNLLTNAAKYTDPGGSVRLGAEARGGEVVLRVRDNGVGIPAGMLGRVFDLFTQLDRTPGRASQWGLGVGLALVKALVELHGGSVTASSDGPGQGSEFVVRLPGVLAAPAAPAAPREQAPRPAARPLRVLIVEDRADAAESLALLLQLHGHEARVARDGPSALKEAASFGPDAVLLDIGLPGMDGYEVARRLRRQEGGGRALLVALTGYGAEDDRRRCLEAGCDGHLVKPAEPAEVIGLLEARAGAGAPAVR
jgi:PAS domain S-box-containing protein